MTGFVIGLAAVAAILVVAALPAPRSSERRRADGDGGGWFGDSGGDSCDAGGGDCGGD